jgi:hypothetical protein
MRINPLWRLPSSLYRNVPYDITVGRGNPSVIFQSAVCNPIKDWIFTGRNTAGVTATAMVEPQSQYHNRAWEDLLKILDDIQRVGLGTRNAVTRAELLDYIQYTVEVASFIATLLGLKHLYDMDWGPLTGARPTEIDVLGRHLDLSTAPFEERYGDLLAKIGSMPVPPSLMAMISEFYSPFTILGDSGTVHMNMFPANLTPASFPTLQPESPAFLDAGSATIVVNTLHEMYIDLFSSASRYEYTAQVIWSYLPWPSLSGLVNPSFKPDHLALSVGKLNCIGEFTTPAQMIGNPPDVTGAEFSTEILLLDAALASTTTGQGSMRSPELLYMNNDAFMYLYSPIVMPDDISELRYTFLPEVLSTVTADRVHKVFNHSAAFYGPMHTMDADATAPYNLDNPIYPEVTFSKTALVPFSAAQVDMRDVLNAIQSTKRLVDSYSTAGSGRYWSMLSDAGLTLSERRIKSIYHLHLITRENVADKLIPMTVFAIFSDSAADSLRDVTNMANVYSRKLPVENLRNEVKGSGNRRRR